MSSKRGHRAIAATLVAVLLAAGCASHRTPAPGAPNTVALLERSLLKLEHSVGETKRLLRTARDESYAPELYLRLAELYAEMSRLRYLLQIERSGRKDGASRVIQAPDVVFLKEAAIASYEKVLEDWPRHAAADKALFFMAHELRELGRFPDMVAGYEKLVRDYPRSAYRLEALLLLGDHYFNSNDFRAAETRYRSILAAKESSVHPMARYKLGWVRINQNDYAGAFEAFEQVVTTTDPRQPTANLDAQKRIDVRREALLDLAFVYTKVRKSTGATNYFMDLCASRAEAIAVLRKLGNRLYMGSDLIEAVRTHRTLISLDPAADDAVEWVHRLYDAVTRGQQNDHAAADVARLASVVEHLRRRRVKDLAKTEADFELYARDLATKRQSAAQGDKTAAADAADAYGVYLTTFPKAKEVATMARNRAEALFVAERFEPAAEAFDQIARTEKRPVRETLFAAVSAAHKALFARDTNRYQATRARSIVRDDGRRMLQAFPADPETPQVEFLIALTYFQEGNFERSAELFAAFARQHPTHRDAVTAAHLSLDALAATEDYDGIRRVGRRLAESGVGGSTLKQEILAIVERAATRQVEVLTLERGGEQALVVLAERNRGTEVGERALVLAFSQAQSAGDTTRMVALGERLRQDYPSSKDAGNILRALGKLHVDRADPDRAAPTLEAAYRAAPQQKGSVQLLLLAAGLYEVHADYRHAIELLEPVASNGAPDEKRRATLKRAELLGKLGDDLAAAEAIRAAEDPGVETQLLLARVASRTGDVGMLRSLVASSEAQVRAAAHFYLGELTYQGFAQIGTEGDALTAVSSKLDALTQAEGFYLEAMNQRSAEWAIASLARLTELYSAAVQFLDVIQEPAELSAEQQRDFQRLREERRKSLSTRAHDAASTCARRAKELNVFTPYARACMNAAAGSGTLPAITVEEFRTETSGRLAASQEVDQLREVLARKPDDIATLKRVTTLALAAADIGLARLASERALEASSNDADLRNLHAVALLRSGEIGPAHRELRRALDAQGKHRAANINMAGLLAMFGRSDEAQAIVRRTGGADALQESPDLWPEGVAALRVTSQKSSADAR